VKVEEFRSHAHQLVDWMADYLAGVEEYPVRSQVVPGEILAQLPASAPEAGEPFEGVFEDFQRIVMPGMTHWQHPGFHAYFPANSSPPSVLAEMLTATLGAQCMLWQTSPAAAELEERVLDWLRQALGLPEGLAGVIQDSASTATLCAILSARERITDFAANEKGLRAAEDLVVYCSVEAHSSVEKAVKIAGLGRQAVRPIAVDENFAMLPGELEKAVASDLAAGHKPTCLVATLGTTGASGFDPLEPLGEICRRHDIWLHVDAAWAGSALLLPEQRWMIAGIEAVDSFVFNPHKWLLTNFDCSAYYVRDPAALVRTFEIVAEYLKTREGDRVNDYRDWSVPLGRRFRALKLWFVLRSYGLQGLREIISRHIELAHELAAKIAAADDFELQVAPRLALFCFRYRPPGIGDEGHLDELNARLLEALNDSGEVYLTQTRVQDRYTIRFCVGQAGTEERHVDKAWQIIQQTARSLAR
jgi:aromatic-L-amino-acid decarboxylase